MRKIEQERIAAGVVEVAVGRSAAAALAHRRRSFHIEIFFFRFSGRRDPKKEN